MLTMSSLVAHLRSSDPAVSAADAHTPHYLERARASPTPPPELGAILRRIPGEHRRAASHCGGDRQPARVDAQPAAAPRVQWHQAARAPRSNWRGGRDADAVHARARQPRHHCRVSRQLATGAPRSSRLAWPRRDLRMLTAERFAHLLILSPSRSLALSPPHPLTLLPPCRSGRAGTCSTAVGLDPSQRPACGGRLPHLRLAHPLGARARQLVRRWRRGGGHAAEGRERGRDQRAAAAAADLARARAGPAAGGAARPRRRRRRAAAPHDARARKARAAQGQPAADARAGRARSRHLAARGTRRARGRRPPRGRRLGRRLTWRAARGARAANAPRRLARVPHSARHQRRAPLAHCAAAPA